MLLVLDIKQYIVLELIRIEYMGHSHKPRNVDRAMFDAFAGYPDRHPQLQGSRSR